VSGEGTGPPPEGRSFIYLTAGTGISSCLVLDGYPFAGARGLAGTMASSPLPARRERPGAAPPPSLERSPPGRPALVARHNARSSRRLGSGEEVALEILRSVGEALGAGIGWLVNVLDPEAGVLGGGLGLACGVYLESLLASARAHLVGGAPRPADPPRRRRGQIRGRAAVDRAGPRAVFPRGWPSDPSRSLGDSRGMDPPAFRRLEPVNGERPSQPIALLCFFVFSS
jgi:predicted NBD/HSP70 family sugar kinase